MTNTTGKRFAALCFGLWLLCAQCICGVAATETETGSGTKTAPIYSGASADAPVIGLMEENTVVTVVAEQGDFYEIDCYDMTGFIAREHLSCRRGKEYYVNCKTDTEHTRYLPYRQLLQALRLRHGLLRLAQAQLGTPYVYGGAQPGGFDCSGLTYYLYGSHGIAIHRTASQQLQDGIVVAKAGMQIGDLVFFREPGETTAASHVGIYAGNNQIIHAGSNGIGYADLDASYFREYFLCARRIINTAGAELPEIAGTEESGFPGIFPGIRGRRLR